MAKRPPVVGLARSATLLSIGNLASRLLGLLREMVIARYFERDWVSAFTVASQTPTLLYDFLIGGMLSAALVPVLSDYAQQDRREFDRLVSVLLSCFGCLLALLTITLVGVAPMVAWLMAGGFSPDLLALTTQLLRVVAPAIWLFCMAGVLTAILYARQRFTWPALATALYNLGIVVAAPLLAHRIGVTSLVVGILAGSALQFLLLGWDLARSGSQVRFSLDWRHPGLQKILRLYLPIGAGLLVSIFQVGLDRRLASGTGDAAIAWMRYATTLQQLPLGLISVAIALAALPQLSQFFARGEERAYRATLGRGLRMVMVLVAPSAVGLWLLGEPITRLIFQGNQFTPGDTSAVVQALNIYLIGMLFAAIDFPLNYAFYARNNTLLPSVVGVFSVFAYVIAAVMLPGRFGYLGLVWADSVKQAVHALAMLLLLYQRVGALHANVRSGLWKIVLAATGMALTIVGINQGFGAYASIRADSFFTDIRLVLLAGGCGLLIYVAILAVCGVEEIGRLRVKRR